MWNIEFFPSAVQLWNTLTVEICQLPPDHVKSHLNSTHFSWSADFFPFLSDCNALFLSEWQHFCYCCMVSSTHICFLMMGTHADFMYDIRTTTFLFSCPCAEEVVLCASFVRWNFLRHLIMTALWNRPGHYVFALWFLSFFLFCFSFNLSGRRLAVYHTSTHANLECRSEMCCMRLAGNAGPNKKASIRWQDSVPPISGRT